MLSDEVEEVMCTPKPKPTHGRYGWVVRVVGKGEDVSDYHVTKVCERAGSTEEVLTMAHVWRKFKRNGATVFGYRAQAREEKKRLCVGKTNHNSFANQRYWDRDPLY
jgi:hypothetical protein